MTPRDHILGQLRANRPAGQHDLPALPRFPVEEPGGRVAYFCRSLKQMGGKVLEGEDLLQALRGQLSGVVCSAVPEIRGNRDLAAIQRPADLADVEAAVVRAVFGIAETGSVAFTEAELGVNAVAYLAQHLYVLLDPADILATTQDAYGRPEFRTASYVVFHTGPSATADIEGVLVHGAQGVRSLTVALVGRAAAAPATTNEDR